MINFNKIRNIFKLVSLNHFLTFLSVVAAAFSAYYAYQSNIITNKTSKNQLELAFESFKNEIFQNIEFIPEGILLSNDSVLTIDFYFKNKSLYKIEEFELQLRYNNIRMILYDKGVVENGFGRKPDSVLTIICKDPFHFVGNEDNTYPIWIHDTTVLNRPFFNQLRSDFKNANSNDIPNPYFEINSEINLNLKLYGIDKGITISKVIPVPIRIIREPTYYFPE